MLPDQALVQVFSSLDELSQEAARLFGAATHLAVAARGRFLVALSGGSTPNALFDLLARQPYREGLPWSQCHLFWGDERLVPPNDEGSNYFHARKRLLDKIAIPAENVHRVKGELPPEAAVDDYRRQLQVVAAPGQRWPRFDLVLLGLGSDGHTASLFPGSALDKEPTGIRAVTAEYEDRPAHRLTLTSAVFSDARHVLFLVAGRDKARALAAVLEGEPDPGTWPAQRIRPAAGRLTWLVDREAAAGLQNTFSTHL